MVVGDLILDEYDYCHSIRLTPDENKPVYDIDHIVYSLGGAANVAHNLVSFGSNVVLVGVIGEDYEAEIFSKLLSTININSGTVLIDKDRHTSIKTRILNNNEFLFRIDRENKADISQRLISRIKNIVSQNLDKVDACIISDYQKGLLSIDLCQFIISAFIKKNKPVFVDPKGINYSKYQGCTVIKPNQKELEAFTGGVYGNNIENIKHAGENLFNQIKCKNVVITIGSKGMLHVDELRVLHSPSCKAIKINASGAGDTAISVIALLFLHKSSWQEILTIANYFCSLVIQKYNTSVVVLSEIKDS